MCTLDNSEDGILKLCSKSWKSIIGIYGMSKLKKIEEDEVKFCENIVYLAKKEFIEIRESTDRIINPSTIDDSQSLLCQNVEVRRHNPNHLSQASQ